MELLGGLIVGGELRKDCGFRPVTGALELAAAQSYDSEEPWPDRVTRVLCEALEHVGGQRPSRELVHGASVGDRQYLARQLTVHLGRDESWLTATCASCDQPFDFPVQEAHLPAKPAGAGYPFASVDLSFGRVRVRVPTGADQSYLAALGPAVRDPERALAHRLIVEPTGVPEDDLSAEDVRLIEAAVEGIAPEVAVHARMVCPSCTAENLVILDPYAGLSRGAGELFADIHLLAGYYHWSESDILAMPRARRQVYTRLVDRARGMAQ